MNRKILLAIVSILASMGLQAETIRVLRFVPVAGAETEVVQSTLRKVVFTPDSVVLIAAEDGVQTPLYKYDYQAIVFDESSSEGLQVTDDGLPAKAVKFIRDGQLFIRLDEQVYNIFGNKIQ